MLKSHIVLGYDAQGNKVRKVIRAETEEDLVIQKYLAKKAFEEQTLPSNLRFGPYARKWLDAYKAGKSTNTRAMYERILGKCEDLNGKKLVDIVQSDLQRIIAANTEYPNTCSKIRLTLRQIFACAVRDGIILRSPAEALEVPKYKAREQRALTDSERIAIGKVKLEDMDRMYLKVLYYFGLRPGEALALMPSDFDFKARFVTIGRSIAFDGNRPILKGTKTENVRSVPIPNEICGELQNYCRSCGLYLFHNADGSMMSRTGKRCMWDRIKREINRQLGGTDAIDLTDGLHQYTFRHDYATSLYYSGISLKKAASLMGHEDTTMIMRVYAHLDEEKEELEKVKNRTINPCLNLAQTLPDCPNLASKSS